MDRSASPQLVWYVQGDRIVGVIRSREPPAVVVSTSRHPSIELLEEIRPAPALTRERAGTSEELFNEMRPVSRSHGDAQETTH